jgi:hypothetical protein
MSFEQLPDEILMIIYGQLAAHDKVAAGATCTRLSSMQPGFSKWFSLGAKTRRAIEKINYKLYGNKATRSDSTGILTTYTYVPYWPRANVLYVKNTREVLIEREEMVMPPFDMDHVSYVTTFIDFDYCGATNLQKRCRLYRDLS